MTNSERNYLYRQQQKSKHSDAKLERNKLASITVVRKGENHKRKVETIRLRENMAWLSISDKD